MIWVFKTSVQNYLQVEILKPALNVMIDGKWSFDLEDCDKILRIACNNISVQSVISLFTNSGFHCEELQD